MAAKRFASHTESDIEEKRKNLFAENTIKSNEKSARILREYLREKEESDKLEEFPEDRLADVLEKFYLDIRRADGELYKVNSLTNVRYGLNRYLKAPPHNKTFDIIKDSGFQRANQSFKSASTELKREGKGDTEHHNPISEADLLKLYGSLYMNPETPNGLANKVQFDIRLYFFRRGAENMHTMTKTTFEVSADEEGMRYIMKKKDELTKNHRELDRELVTAIMPESRGNPRCPVASYLKYLSKLHPHCDRLWQKPLDSYLEDEVWFCNRAIGIHTLEKFMPRLSQSCKLSTPYHNHSIRATGATVLSKCKFGPAQIMAVTGHKRVQSLAVYQHVGDDEKMEMGKAIQSETFGDKYAVVPVQRAPHPPAMTVPSSTSSATSVVNTAEFHLRGVNLRDIICDYDQLPQSTAPSMPLFHGCQITTLNIHYHQQ